MVRNTGPVNSAQRWPEATDGRGAPRQDQTHDHQFKGYPHNQGQPPHAGGTEGAGGYDPYAAQQQPGYPQPDPAYAGQGGYGGQPQMDPAYQHGYAPPQASTYAPQFEPYQPPQPAGRAGQAWDGQNWQGANGAAPGYPQGHQGHYQGQVDPHGAPQAGFEPPRAFGQRETPYGMNEGEYRPPVAPQASFDPRLRGSTYDQTPSYGQEYPGWPTPAPASDPYAQQPPLWGDASGYDSAAGYAPQPAHDYAQSGYGQHQGSYGEPAYAPPYAQEPGFGPADGGYPAPATIGEHGIRDDYGSDEIVYEDEQRGGSRRLVKVAAALLVAIGIGGGLAYGYKSFMGTSGSGKTPVVRTADSPSKIKPDEPGGKKFAHTDSKVLGRLSDSSAQANAGGAADKDNDPNGTRKVSTMVVGRDGSIVASQEPERAPPSKLPDSSSPVPGMTIVDGFGNRRPQVSDQPPASANTMVNTAQQAAPTPPAAPAETASTPAKPVVIARTEPEVAEPQAEEPKPAATTKASRSLSAARETKTAALAPATPPAASASSGAGYVAVLASIPSSANSRMDALKRFADLQQKYSSQLGGKTPDVQEANLGAKGNYHRLIVGPPGSRQQANDLCNELKTAGYTGCWVKGY